VAYRIGRPDPGLALLLPRDPAPSHPLVIRRRSAKPALAKPLSARRAAITEPPPRSPWRRRLRRRVAANGAPAAFSWSPRPWWERLRAAVLALAAGVIRR
jgi:hypothetical protein